MNGQERAAVPAGDIAAARLLLEKMGIDPADLLHEPAGPSQIPTSAEYIPRVSQAAGEGTRRVYSTPWNRKTASDPGQAGHRTPVPIASEPAGASGPSRWASGDSLIGIAGIRVFFGIGRTAAYELTHRPGFPDPVPISARRYRWWASEVEAFATALRHQRSQASMRRPAIRPRLPDPAVPPGRITGKVRAARTRRESS